MTDQPAPIDKRAVARTLEEISRYLEISEANRFKTIAFRNAARRMEDVSTDMNTFVETGAVNSTPGIGKAIGPMIVELVTTGRLRYLEELRKQYPPGILDLMRVPGLGLRKIGLLYEKLGVAGLEDLQTACRENKLVTLPGFGKKTQQKIAEGIEFLQKQGAKVLLPRGMEAAESAQRRLEEIEGVEEVLIAGAIRRRLEVVQDVVLIVTSKKPETTAAKVLEQEVFDRSQLHERELQATARYELPMRVLFCEPEEAASTLLLSTGSVEFIDALTAAASAVDSTLKLEGLWRKGKKIVAKTEEALFSKLGIAYVEPELREDATWLGSEAPVLVERGDIQGVFHNHTTYSDGRATLEEMLTAARAIGYRYIGISDHSKLASYAGGLTEDRLVEQEKELEGLRAKFKGMRIFRGSEADILADGSIDYGEPTLGQFDFVVASVHSRFKMDRSEMTERMLQAIANPRVTFLGHLTGRLLLSREGYTVDFDKVFDAAARFGVMIEINGNPRRLDLDWRRMQRALDRGVIFSINPDAHSTQELLLVQNGVWAARKGGLPASKIFNTLPVEGVEEHFARRKQRAEKMVARMTND